MICSDPWPWSDSVENSEVWFPADYEVNFTTSLRQEGILQGEPGVEGTTTENQTGDSNDRACQQKITRVETSHPKKLWNSETIQNKLSHVKPKKSLEQYFRTPFALSGGGLLTTPTQCCELWDGQGGGGQGDGPELSRVEMDWVMIYRVYSRLKLL